MGRCGEQDGDDADALILEVEPSRYLKLPVPGTSSHFPPPRPSTLPHNPPSTLSHLPPPHLQVRVLLQVVQVVGVRGVEVDGADLVSGRRDVAQVQHERRLGPEQAVRDLLPHAAEVLLAHALRTGGEGEGVGAGEGAEVCRGGMHIPCASA